MSNLIQINSFANKFSPNLLGIGSSFTDINQIYNITSGTGTLQFGTAKEYGYFADVSNNSFTTTDFVFNFGNTLKSNIFYSDNYIFQMSFIDFVSGPNSFLPFDIEVLIYKDGINTDTLLLNFDLNSVVFDGKVATFSQSIFISGTVNVVDFAFKIIHNPSALNSNLDFRFGNLKLERDDKFLGLPTPYSLPVNYYIQSQGTGDNKVTGNIEMEVGVEPTEPQHLTTKAYVDSPENQTESQRSTATTGTESVNNNGINTIFIHDAVSLALTLTVNLPSTPVNNQIVTLNSVLGVTTLTLVTLVGSIVGGVTALAAGVSVRYIWMASQNKWYKI